MPDFLTIGMVLRSKRSGKNSNVFIMFLPRKQERNHFRRKSFRNSRILPRQNSAICFIINSRGDGYGEKEAYELMLLQLKGLLEAESNWLANLANSSALLNETLPDTVFCRLLSVSRRRIDSRSFPRPRVLYPHPVRKRGLRGVRC